MIVQFFLYLGATVWDWMSSVSVPTEMWEILGFMYSGLNTLAGYTLALPYLPYAALGNILTSVMVVFVAFMVIAAVAFLLRLFKLTGS